MKETDLYFLLMWEDLNFSPEDSATETYRRSEKLQ